MRKLTFFSFAALLAWLLAAVPWAASAQSGSFIVSQHGKQVGTASFHFTASPDGYDSRSLVRISMQGLDYALSKSERLTSASQLGRAQLSAVVNGSAVTVTAAPKPESGPESGRAPALVLTTSANGRISTTGLAPHPAAVFLPDFDPGALETLLTLAVTSNNRGLWAIIPKKAGSIEPVQLATRADEQGTLDGKPIAVHHLAATIAGAATDLFSGPENQLLQAELPEQGFALVRQGFLLTPPAKAGAPPAADSQPAAPAQ
jgi:hypothetical protein